jgi:hypothetical protein
MRACQRLVFVGEREILLLQMRRDYARDHPIPQAHYRAIHAGAVMIEQCHVFLRSPQQSAENGRFKHQIGFDQQNVLIERRLFERQRQRMDIVSFVVAGVMDELKAIARIVGAEPVAQLLGPVARNDNGLFNSVFDQTIDDAADDRSPACFEQSLVRVIGQGTHAASIACRQDETFHRRTSPAAASG